jgi:hypothetical protein
MPLSASSSTAKSPGCTITPPTLTGTSTAHGLPSGVVPTVETPLLQTANSPSAQSSPHPATSRIRPSMMAPTTPRSLKRVATMSPRTADMCPEGCWSRAMDPGAGTSVQCLSLGMLFSAGMVVPTLFVVDEIPPWWEYETKRTVLMGAMMRRDGLFAWGAGTKASGQCKAPGRK